MASQDLSEQLQAAGLEVTGTCAGLSKMPVLLRESPLLQDFTPAEAEVLGAAMLRVRARPGQVLIAEGDMSEWLMLLLQGTVDVAKRNVAGGEDAGAQGDGTRVAVVRGGAVLGEMSMFDGEPRYASCRAITEVEAAVLGRSSVALLIAVHPQVGAKLLVKLTQLLAQRLRNTSNQLVKVLRRREA